MVSEQEDALTGRIIGCAFKVSNGLGCGFLEKVYENALAHEIHKSGLLVRQQHPVKVRYDGVVVGDYVVDLLVEDKIVVELKAGKTNHELHKAQCLNYLKATGMEVCLLLNFAKPKVKIDRFSL